LREERLTKQPMSLCAVSIILLTRHNLTWWTGGTDHLNKTPNLPRRPFFLLRNCYVQNTRWMLGSYGKRNIPTPISVLMSAANDSQIVGAITLDPPPNLVLLTVALSQKPQMILQFHLSVQHR
jgi:hypothetical protein